MRQGTDKKLLNCSDCSQQRLSSAEVDLMPGEATGYACLVGMQVIKRKKASGRLAYN